VDDTNSVYLRSHYQHRLIGEILWTIGDDKINHERRVFNLINYFENMGGIAILLFEIAYFFIYPIS